MRFALAGLLLVTVGLGSLARADMAPPPPAATGVLAGKITDVKTHKGMAGVTVQAAGPRGVETTTTGSKGRYVFASLPPGAYAVIASHAGGAQVSRAGINVTSGTTTECDLAMPAAPQLK
jgi:hypothetical protein